MELRNFFASIGIAVSGLALIHLAREIFVYVRPSSLPRYLKKDEKGTSWAFISGASDGIGLGFAHELCRRGFNVFIHGRNYEKLRRLQDDLCALYPERQTKIVIYDASELAEDVDERIMDEVGDARLTLLVNNVGGMAMMKPSPYVKLHDFSYNEMKTVLDVNANFTAQLTRILLPRLMQSQPSLVINISSIAKLGFPWLVPYSATKAFVSALGEGLSAEMRADKQDVEILGVIVGSVSTAGHNVSEGLFVPSAGALASATLDRVGCNRLSVWGYWSHRLRGFPLELISQKTFQAAATKEIRRLRQDILDKAADKDKDK
ncbi:putative short chain dehydrogenase/reductase [Talaromyces proteolyticus]|uniref:Short chain dehydrogenase/reductase n=1 Tax=Talaromyces proteolyticus TaxID=1131652 RepID=A0AAD4PZ43_9EURO|nr:putative short chain dehydrogenase/reductase [Talaromyces proteolyticus]KAH8698621.1 putative short chain dehydrogenase/reductase [Talaromyces proteolyticus]